MSTFPTITVVTPNYNQAAFLEATILSVINQGYPNLEYIIMDGGSTDGSVEIIKKYESQLTYWVSEKDGGMYNALNKGFDKATGEVLMYINSDDILMPGCLSIIGKIFVRYPGINWITGYYHWLNEANEVIGIKKNSHWSVIDYINNNYQWIQQESTVWSRTAWNNAGAKFNTKFKLAADMDLWSKFFLQSNPVVADFGIGAFRIRANQLSQTKINEYHQEAYKIISQLKMNADKKSIRNASYFKIISRLKYYIQKTVIFNHYFLIEILNKILLKIRGKDERIVYEKDEWLKRHESNASLYKL